MGDSIYRCPVCGDEFENVGEADRHFDYHRGSEYVATWEVKGGGEE